MFTGLIQSLGHLFHRGNGELHIRYPDSVHPLLADLELGDSIAVDGICLTVEAITAQGFRADVSPETLARTTLGELPEGSWVNLESSLRAGGKIGGHFVTGHIDGRGLLAKAQPTDNAWELSFTVPDPRVARYLVPKGSIAVNGISLTVADCSPRGDWFSVAVIPVTYRETTLQYLQPGQPVNLEGDLLGKYVEKFLQGRRDDSVGSALETTLSLEFLTEHGYSL
ncbi:MAG TPA: riboflavin synthase [Leptolyngbyaceae cyanobacterium M65_K2018_010]|nr:riboflavin synthase [Leptolyngbyaceae cyanobacterium M65_K2018_010]